MITIRLSLALCVSLLLTGCGPPGSSRSYIGMATNDTEWPYRYRLTQGGGAWSGIIERRDTNGWVFWDKMEIIHQSSQEINFKARIGEAVNFRPGWSLNLGTLSPQTISATLTGDIFDSRAIGLLFETPVVKPNDSL